LAGIVLVAGSAGYLDLLDGNHLTRRCVQGEVNAAIRPFSNQLTPYPFEDRWRGV
jgi:hypothetical protein